jgi:pilus assembly protein CpaF
MNFGKRKKSEEIVEVVRYADTTTKNKESQSVLQNTTIESHKLEENKETKKLETLAVKEVNQKARSSTKLEDEPNRRHEIENIKVKVFSDLLDVFDLSSLSEKDKDEIKSTLVDIIDELILTNDYDIKNELEKNKVIEDICDDVLGFGPLEPLLRRQDIADIMVNGPDKVYIETKGRIELTDIRFRDQSQLMNICQRIVSAVGRRVDEANPICDARLADGSRVNVIAPPLALDGATLTIRKFSSDKLKLPDLVKFGSISIPGSSLIEVIAQCRCNVLISGGTGSGKTTLLNCLTDFIEEGERVITCEDAAELQLKNPHVVRLETRPPNIEGTGAITMRDLVRNCLRMRPERIIVGEVRGPEAFDLLQAMNTGHDGSMGTVHANSPREALSRLENMIAMGGYNLPVSAVREQINGSLNVVIQAERLRDGSRRITNISEIIGMENDIITMQELLVFRIEGEDNNGRIVGSHVLNAIRPSFWDKAKYFGLEDKLNTIYRT